jgi:hypothetical protein
MKPSIQSRKTTAVFFIGLLVASFALGPVPNAFGVVPPPDGGYPNFTTAEGTKALQHLTSGAGNTAVGWYSLFSAKTASFNTALGAGALALNTSDENTATGVAALLLNTSGFQNTATGALALLDNDTGSDNTATGFQALSQNTIGTNNTATGANTLGSNTGGSGNTAMGNLALGFNTTGGSNTAVGVGALLHNTTFSDNTAVGTEALFNNSGSSNTAVGSGALTNNTSANDNTAVGFQALLNNSNATGNTATGALALLSNTTGAGNTANGDRALRDNNGNGNTATGAGALIDNTSGSNNTASGAGALLSNTAGSFGTAVGQNALLNNSTGSGNTALGVGAGTSVHTADNVICIGSVGAEVSNSCFIGNIFGVTSPSGTGVFINSSGQLGTTTSSRRFKERIRPVDKASEALFSLRPVTFHYKEELDPGAVEQFGLIAEDVERVNPDLVVRDKDGKPYSVRYDQVNAMLLNEFLKEHATVQELKKEIAELKAGLQKVSAQIGTKTPTMQPVQNGE